MDTLKRIEKIIRQRAFNNKKKKPGLKFNSISRKVVGKKVIWDMTQYTVPNTVAVKLTFVASRAIFAISLKNSELKTTTIPLGIVACTFSDDIS